MNFLSELQRRNVFRVAIAYAVAAWVLLQVADLVLENIDAPPWVIQAMMLFVALGFIAAVVIAWAYEITPEGIKRERDVDRSRSITHVTRRKLDRIIIGFLVVAVAYFIWESRFSGKAPGPEYTDTAQQVETGAETGGAPAAQGTDSGHRDNSIAVLPFANRSMQQEDLYFTDGIHDDLLTQLAKMRDLKVISRTSMMKYRDTRLSIPEIASELGVSTILEGGVQRAGKRIRINAQLIDVTNDQHLWAETFDREMTMENIFDIQSEITRRIVAAVRGELTEAESQALGRLPTTNVKAYEAYIRARMLTNHGNWAKEYYIQAQPWAEMAVELDPGFAQAWSLLATIHGQALWMAYDPSPERHQAMKKAVDMANLLGPDEPLTLLAQAEYAYRVESDYSASLTLLQRAHEAQPGNVDILERMALSQRRLGFWEESVGSALEGVALDPGNVASARLAIETLAMMRAWDRVLALGAEWSDKFESTDIQVILARAHAAGSGDLDRAREIMESTDPVASESWANFATFLPLLERDYQAAIDAWDRPEVVAMLGLSGWIGWRETSRGVALLKLGKTDEAHAQFRQAREMLENAQPVDTSLHAYNLEALAIADAMLGENERALETSRKAKEIVPESADALDGTDIASLHAYILALTGHRDEALLEIERLLDKPSGLVRWYLYLDPTWDFFRDDERFNELIRPEGAE